LKDAAEVQQVARMKQSEIRGQPFGSPKSIMGSATSYKLEDGETVHNAFLIGISVRNDS
jgi:hypothetical protein